MNIKEAWTNALVRAKTEVLRRHRRYFRGATLNVRTDSDELSGTVMVDGDACLDIDPAQFLALVEDCTE